MALVEGRRSGSNEAIAFDEAAAEVGSGGVSWGLAERRGPLRWLRQRTSEAMHTSSVRGRKRRHWETQRGGASADAPPGPRRVLARSCIGATVLHACIGESVLCRSWSVAVKRGSIRGAAGGYLRRNRKGAVSGRRRISTKRGVARPTGRCNRKLDSPEGARFESRLQKLVRCIFLVRTACGATRGRERLDSLKEDASL